MKKTQKTIFGFLGLLTVVAMTVIAAVIPSPGASANSMTDTINVRVVGSVTNVKFKKPSENTITTNDVISFAFDYENASSARLALSYTNKNGDTVSLPDYESYPDLDYGAGTENGSFNIPAHGLSYGKYVLSLYAKGAEGTEVFYDSVSVEYIPVIAEAEQNEDDGLVDLDLSDFTDEVEKVDIYVDGELIATVDKKDFDETVKLDFGERTSGEYKIEVIAKDAENKTLYKAYEINVHYEGLEAPNTGFFFQGLNISKEDYLITGLIIFFVFGVVAFGIVARGSKRK
ncbi:hypothetical protein J5868_02995 [Candidatus Saccharibacteria bacterium]|nr:hypothetical protein [Candidatus Saccharibacteria bacterium]